VNAIAKAMKRTLGAVRQKATSLGQSVIDDKVDESRCGQAVCSWHLADIQTLAVMSASYRKRTSRRSTSQDLWALKSVSGVDSPLLFPLHGIVSRILVQLGKAWEIKASVDERLECRIHLHRHKSYVDQLNRLLPDQVGADQAHVMGSVD
jgi:hypothetical protein